MQGRLLFNSSVAPNFCFPFQLIFLKSSCFLQVTPTTSFGMDNDILNASQQKFQVGGILTSDSMFPLKLPPKFIKLELPIALAQMVLPPFVARGRVRL